MSFKSNAQRKQKLIEEMMLEREAQLEFQAMTTPRKPTRKYFFERPFGGADPFSDPSPFDNANPFVKKNPFRL